MDRKLGNAKQARRLASLFKKWRRACDRQDTATMAATKRAIEALGSGRYCRSAARTITSRG